MTGALDRVSAVPADREEFRRAVSPQPRGVASHADQGLAIRSMFRYGAILKESDMSEATVFR